MCFEIKKVEKTPRRVVGFKVVRRAPSPNVFWSMYSYAGGFDSNSGHRTQYNVGEESRQTLSKRDARSGKSSTKGFYIYATLRAAKQKCTESFDKVVIKVKVNPKDFLFQGHENGTYRRPLQATYRAIKIVGVVNGS